jgi:hypothetical protein
MNANRERREQARQESESFHNSNLLRRSNITKASLLQDFALRASALNFELSAATGKQWHGDFGAYGIRTRDLLNAIEALYQLS